MTFSVFSSDLTSPRVLEDVGSKLPDELTVLGEDLDLPRIMLPRRVLSPLPGASYLVSGGPLSHHDVSSLDHHGHSVGVEELAVPLTDLSKLELEIPALVEHLYSVVVGVRHDNLVILSDRHTAGLRELSLQDPKLSKLAVIDHLLPPDLSLGRVGDWCRGDRSGEGDGGEGAV